MISQSSHPDPRVRREAEALADKGYEVDIICYAEQKSEPKKEKFGSITVYRILLERRFDSVPKYFFYSMLFFIRTFFKLQILSLVRGYDLIQIHNMPDFHVFTALFQKLAGIPVVLDLHDLTPELFESKWEGKKSSSILGIVKFAEMISCRFTDKLITVTDACKENLTNRGIHPDKITIVMNTPDNRIFRYDNNRGYKIIKKNAKLIYHGTVAERFGLHVAIQALKYINNRVPGSTLTIYGGYDKSYKIYLQDQIKELGLEDNVYLMGIHNLEEIYGFIQESDFGVVPYLDNLYMNLALSTKMFEYNASLLPVVASKLRSFSKIFDNDSIAFTEPENALDLADKIIKLCFNPDKRRMLAENAYITLQNISWEVMSERYIKLINSTIIDSRQAHKKIIRQQNRVIGRRVL
jgi:glycosyltransferase involved in cell wall biosynthesis